MNISELIQLKASDYELAQSTVESYVTCKNIISKFLGKDSFDENDIASIRGSDFIKHLSSLGLKNSTIHKLVRNFNTFIHSYNEYLDLSIPPIKILNKRKYKVSPSSIALNQSQISSIKSYLLSNPSFLLPTKRTKPIFALQLYYIGCLSGVGLSDWAKIKKSQLQLIDNQRYIKVTSVTRSKTGVYVPLMVKVDSLEGRLLMNYYFRSDKYWNGSYCFNKDVSIGSCSFDEKVLNCSSSNDKGYYSFLSALEYFSIDSYPLDRFGDYGDDSYLFPILGKRGKSKSDMMSAFILVVNRNLRDMVKEVNDKYGCGIPSCITMYSSRHSFASSYVKVGGEVSSLAILMGRSVEGIGRYLHSVINDDDVIRMRKEID